MASLQKILFLLSVFGNVIIVCIMIFYVFFESAEKILVKRLRETTFLHLMQMERRLFSFGILWAALWSVIQFPLLVRHLLTSQAWSGYDLFKLVFMLIILFLVVYYRKTWRHNLVSDNKTIYFDWYIARHLELNKKKQFDKAFECLTKASGLKPDSVFIWCNMAHFVECFYKDLDRADRYLSRAREIIGANPNISAFDRSVYEHYIGAIAGKRDAVDESLSHFKAAYELDPRPYRKEQYEKAVRLAEAKKGAL